MVSLSFSGLSSQLEAPVKEFMSGPWQLIIECKLAPPALNLEYQYDPSK